MTSLYVFLCLSTVAMMSDPNVTSGPSAPSLKTNRHPHPTLYFKFLKSCFFSPFVKNMPVNIFKLSDYF